MQRFDFTYTPSRGPDRGTCARYGREAVAITDAGHYTAPSGKRVDIAAATRRAIETAKDYRPEADVVAPAITSKKTVFRVVNGTSLSSAREIAARGVTPLVLNFASARHPGGGFLNGARAQEESLARSSALFATIKDSPMYAFHEERRDAMYSHWMIHSRDVPVFRDDDSGALLEEPYLCSFLTSPAPNAGVVLERDPSRGAEVERVMRERVERALAICAAEGHTHLVLGAWGCGVFQNDPKIVADAFAKSLGDRFAEVVFAVLDWSDDRHFVRPFVERFAS